MKPLDMILYCPNCGMQHIDAPEPGRLISGGPAAGRVRAGWSNPPHKSHLCHGCGCIWRPADVPTNGVAELKTSGKDDTWPAVHNEEVRAARGAALGDATEQSLGLYAAQADAIRELLDKHAPFTTGSLQVRVAQLCLCIVPDAAGVKGAPAPLSNDMHARHQQLMDREAEAWERQRAVGVRASEAPRRPVEDSRCPYVTGEGRICNKCGRIHDGKANAAVPFGVDLPDGAKNV